MGGTGLDQALRLERLGQRPPELTPSARWLAFPRGALLSVLLAGAVFAAIWQPELAHWHVRPAALPDPELQAARKAPARAGLEEIGAMQLRSVESYPERVVETADLLMGGTLSLPGFPPAPLALPFDPRDLRRGLPTWQLMVASLAGPDILLDAYRLTRREPYFAMARDMIVAFARFEAGRWVDHGFLWNDHAIAARVSVLAKFWAEYRDRPDFDAGTARIVLGLVARGAQLLAKPSFYAWRTGHGVLSDLALLQVAAAFPQLAESATARNVAVERFNRHLPYYVNSEGVTLLHSAGYHSSSLHAFGIALRLYTLNAVDIPPEWWDRYAKALEFYALLRRPDATLPMFGDTFSLPEGAGPPVTARGAGGAEPMRLRSAWARGSSHGMYPAGGHAVWWDEAAAAAEQAQTTITWAHHPGLGHKLADELSMIVWARGRTWLTNAGYWPYGTPGRAHAESWEASNAPHLLGEGKGSARSARVRAAARSDRISFLDAERRGPAEYAVRRQIARIPGADAWLVLDHSLDAAERVTTTNWTFYPDLVLQRLSGAGSYRVSAREAREAMFVSVSGSPGVQAEDVVGRSAPFAGWVVMERSPARSPAIVLRQPSRDSWSLSAFVLADAARAADPGRGARMLHWRGPEDWAVALSAASGEHRLTRDGGKLLLQGPASEAAADPVALAVPDSPEREAAQVRDAVRWAQGHYRKFAELYSYRWKISAALLALLAVQELTLLVLAYWRPRAAGILRAGAWAVWAAGGVWLSQVYLVVQR